MKDKIHLVEWVKPMAELHAETYVEDVLGIKKSNPKYKKEFNKAVQEFCHEFHQHSLVPHAEEGTRKRSNPRIILKVKPTRYNVELLKRRGLYSDDSEYFFTMYEKILNGEIYEKDITDDRYIDREFSEAGIKF